MGYSLFAGVIEGFFGKVWSWQARREMVSFLGRSGFGFYIYAPKSDAFLRRRWREPIPDDSMQSLAALAGHCRAAGITFGVGLSPFEIWRDNDAQARSQLRAKVRQLDQLGADLLCILFDDMRGDTPGLARLQCAIVEDIAGWSRASRFLFCPTYYSTDPLLARVFGEPPAGYLEDVGRGLDTRVEAFWTGQAVCSDCYPAPHLEEVARILRRKPFLWDNNIANDAKSRCARIFLQPDSGRWELRTELAAGIAINPMNQPALSQIALCEYRRLLQLRGVAAADCCADAGPEVGRLLRENLTLWQTEGLGSLDAWGREAWAQRFAAHPGNAVAVDMLNWLRGEYQFDPACLTD